MKRRMTVARSVSYLYDPEEVQRLYEQFAPAPNLFGDDPAYALFAYLNESLLGNDVFEDQGDFGEWPEKDEPYDPEA